MSKKNTGVESYNSLHDAVHHSTPHLYAWFSDEEDFRELRIQHKPDGSCLAIAKGYGSDGGPIVCFGVGYGMLGAFIAVDRTIQAGNWREDPPYHHNGMK